MKRYKLVTATDKTVWLSIQPMIDDLKEQLADNMDKEHLVVALSHVKSFLEALLIEARTQDANTD